MQIRARGFPLALAFAAGLPFALACSDKPLGAAVDGGTDAAAGSDGSTADGGGAGSGGQGGGGGTKIDGGAMAGCGPDGARCSVVGQRCDACPTECTCTSNGTWSEWSCSSTPRPCSACAGTQTGACSPGSGLSCLACGTIQPGHYLCTTACQTNAECRDSARPKCDMPPGATTGVCVAMNVQCCWFCKCASPETPIATPNGDKPIASLRTGDIVLSLDSGKVVAVPVLRITRTPAVGHHVVRVLLENGSRLEISEGHPTADGRVFRDLAPGDWLGGARVLSVQSVSYIHAFTHDILPASDSGSYFAGGALIGSTLARP